MTWAVEINNVRAAESVIEASADIEAGDEIPLNCTARPRQNEIVRMVLELTLANSLQCTGQERDPFAASILGGQETDQALLAREVNTNAKDSDCGAALQWAAWYEHVEMVKLLVEAGVEIESGDKLLGRALHKTLERDTVDVVRILMDYVSDVNAVDRVCSPLARAAMSGGEELALARLFLKRDTNVNS